MPIPVPPTAELVDRVYHFALPAAGGAAFVVCLFAILGRRAGSLGAAAAVVFAFLWANFDPSESLPEWERAAGTPFAWGKTGRLFPWTTSDDRPEAWHWLPRAALTLVVVGLLSRWLGLLAKRYVAETQWWVASLLVWLPRIGAVAAVAAWLVADRWVERHGPWLVYVLATVMFVEWFVLDGIARSRVGGRVAVCQAVIFLAASVLLVYHQWPKAAEFAIVLGCAMFGVAVAAGATKSDESGAVPAGVACLPGLLLAGWEQQNSQIPVTAFWLLALAPLALTPLAIPWLNRQNGWHARVTRAVFVLTPVTIALVLTALNQPSPF